MVTLWQICKCSSQEDSLRLVVLGPKQFEALGGPGYRGFLSPAHMAAQSSSSRPRMTSSGLHNPSSTFILPPNSSEYVLVTGSIIQARRLCEDDQTPAWVWIRSGRLHYRRSKYTSQAAFFSWSFVFKFCWSCIVVLSSLVTTLVGTAKSKTKS